MYSWTMLGVLRARGMLGVPGGTFCVPRGMLGVLRYEIYSRGMLDVVRGMLET